MTTKVCSKCHEEKDASEFNKRLIAKDGLGFWCKDCVGDHNNSPAARSSQLKWQLKKRFDINVETYDIMFDKQEGRCAICSRRQDELKQRLTVDHNHVTGKIRGLLCFDCNTSLGHFREDITLLEKAIVYLQSELK